MAEYIKFRLTAAKASVTLALLALVGGLPGAAGAKQNGPSARPASFQWGDPIYLNYGGLPGDVQTVFRTLQYKLNTALSSLSHKINTSFYDKHKIDTTFLKIDTANKLYYKESQVNASFLKIEDANAEFLRTDAANAEFLKVTDANAKFLTINGTATDSNKLGGMTPDAFVQGHANVVSGQVTLNGDGKVHPLLQTVDGSVLIGLLVDGNGNEFINIHNGTSATLTGVADPTAVEFSISSGGDKQISAGSTVPTSPTVGPSTDGSLMTHIQIFPNAAINDVITLTISSEGQTQGQVTAVGQMLIGLL